MVQLFRMAHCSIQYELASSWMYAWKDCHTWLAMRYPVLLLTVFIQMSRGGSRVLSILTEYREATYLHGYACTINSKIWSLLSPGAGCRSQYNTRYMYRTQKSRCTSLGHGQVRGLGAMDSLGFAAHPWSDVHLHFNQLHESPRHFSSPLRRMCYSHHRFPSVELEKVATFRWLIGVLFPAICPPHPQMWT